MPLWVPMGVSFTGKFSPNFNVKIMISTYTKDFFHGEKSGPNSPKFKFKKIPNRQSLIITSRR